MQNNILFVKKDAFTYVYSTKTYTRMLPISVVLRNKKSIPVVYRGNKTWVLVLMRMNLITDHMHVMFVSVSH